MERVLVDKVPWCRISRLNILGLALSERTLLRSFLSAVEQERSRGSGVEVALNILLDGDCFFVEDGPDADPDAIERDLQVSEINSGERIIEEIADAYYELARRSKQTEAEREWDKVSKLVLEWIS